MEDVSTSVQDSKSKFLKKQFYQLWSIFFFSFDQFIWIQKLNWILLLAIGISFPRSVRGTFAEYVMMQTNNLKVVINSKAENVQFA